MSANATYTVISQVPGNYWQESLNKTISGWKVGYRDNATGVVGYIVVDDDHYTAVGVDTLIRQQLDTVGAVAQLGSAPAPQPAE